MRRALPALVALLGACNMAALTVAGADLADAAAPALDLGVVDLAGVDLSSPPPDLALGCTASNYLTRDSFDSVAQALLDCQSGKGGCSGGSNTLDLFNVPQGVGHVGFVYTSNPDGTHSLTGLGTPDVTPAPAGIVLRADHIPRAVSLADALAALYGLATPPAVVCAWI